MQTEVQRTAMQLEALPLWRPELELLALVSVGAVLIFLARTASRLSELLPMNKGQRALWRRLQPLLALIWGCIYLVFSTRVLLRHTVGGQLIGYGMVAVLITIAAWATVRDILAGVVLKASRTCAVGDEVRFEDHEGRVDQMGLRTLTIETRQGEEAVIPYSQIVRQAVLKTPVIEGSVLYVFRLRARADASVPQVRQAVLERALCSHWASSVRAPQIKAVGGREFEVTVFALHADYGPEIEAHVRSATLFAQSPR